jgi:3-oxoacyl-[acyl-carrier protein] reductase
MEFSERVAIVTGGSSGIGKCTAATLGARGAKIIISDINEERSRNTIEEFKGKNIEAQSILTDVSDTEQIKNLVDKTISLFGRIDILVNCVGISKLTKILDLEPAEWDMVLSTNLKSTFFCSQEVLRYMVEAKFGKIINLASAAGKIGGVAVGAHYAASKAAIICVTKSLALFAAPYNVNVNCVCPGPTETPLTDEWGDELNTGFKEKIPFKRYAQPQEVAEAICFLASSKASYITGETMDVNGGLVMD